MRPAVSLFLLLLSALPTAHVRAETGEQTAAAKSPLKEAALTRLQPYTAAYEVRLNNLPFKANARQTLAALGGDRWRLELRIESFLIDTLEFSEFRWDGRNCHTIPERYGYIRKGLGRNRHVNMSFDFSKRIVTRDDQKATSSFAITDNVEDKLGHTLAMACRVARGARGETSIDVAWDYDVRHFEYQIGKTEETISTPSGSYRAWRVERLRADSDRITTSWLAANAGWQAVQMQHSEGDGRFFQLRLMELDRAK